MKPRVSIIAAIGRNRELGKGNELLWHIPEDLKRFRKITIGHPVIMGRKTWESLPEKLRPLPQRTNIVVTRDRDSTHAKIENFSGTSVLEFANSIEKALELAKKLGKEIFIIGGAQIYEQALPYTDKLYLTLIDDEKNADTFFPEYENNFSRKKEEGGGEYGGVRYSWVEYEK